MSTPSAAPAPGAASSLSVTLSWGAEFGALFKLGWPLMVAQLAQISLNNRNDVQGTVVENAGVARLYELLFDELWNKL